MPYPGLSERFVIRNKNGTPPLDIWGRRIVSGATVVGVAGPRLVARVDEVRLGENHAGFYFIQVSSTGQRHESPAGAHVDWELIAPPGRPVPDSPKDIRRDRDGRPVLGPLNGEPREQPPCRFHGFDPASTDG